MRKVSPVMIERPDTFAKLLARTPPDRARLPRRPMNATLMKEMK